MIRQFIRYFGLCGSWRWAVRQMRRGKIVYRTTDTGAAKYKLDDELQCRIVWAVVRELDRAEWSNANIFLDDFKCIAWAIWEHQK